MLNQAVLTYGKHDQAFHSFELFWTILFSSTRSSLQLSLIEKLALLMNVYEFSGPGSFHFNALCILY